MKPTCPECGAELALPSFTEKHLDSIDTKSLMFECPACEKELSVSQFAKGNIEDFLRDAGWIGAGTPVVDDIVDKGLDALGLGDDDDDALDIGELDTESVDVDESLDLNDALDSGETLDLDGASPAGNSAELGTPELSIADVDDDEEIDLNLVVGDSGDASDVDGDFVADELPSLDELDTDSDAGEFELDDEIPPVAGSVMDSLEESVDVDEELVDDAVDVADELESALASEPIFGGDESDDGVADEEMEWLSEDLLDDDTDLETEDTLVEGQEAAAIETPVDLGARDGADGFEPTDTATAAGIFEMRDPPMEATLQEPVAPAPDAKATDQATAPFDYEQSPPPGSFQTAPLPPKRGGLLSTLLKVGVGAVGTLAILQGIAWWGLGIDPAGLADLAPSFLVPKGMKTARVVSFPQRRPDSFPTDDSGTEDGSDSRSSMDDGSDSRPAIDNERSAPDAMVDAAPETEQPQTPAFESDIPPKDTPPGAFPGDSAMADGGSETKPAATDDVASNPLGGFDDPADDDLGDLADTDSEDDLADMLGAADPPIVDANSLFEGNHPEGFETYSVLDLAGSINSASQALQEFEETRLAETRITPRLKQAGRNFYMSYADVAEQATLLRRVDSEDALSKSRDLLRELTPEQQGRCSAWASAWMAKDLGKGIVFAADVNGVTKSGELFEIGLTLANKAKTQVTAVTRVDPKDNDIMSFDSGTRVLIMGVIVNNPSDILPGYLGLESKVVYLTDLFVQAK